MHARRWRKMGIARCRWCGFLIGIEKLIRDDPHADSEVKNNGCSSRVMHRFIRAHDALCESARSKGSTEHAGG